MLDFGLISSLSISLVATIHFQTPDVVSEAEAEAVADYIPLNPPADFFRGNTSTYLMFSPANFSVLFGVFTFVHIVRELPGVGELMLASFPVDSDFNISSGDYWYSYHLHLRSIKN